MPDVGKADGNGNNDGLGQPKGNIKIIHHYPCTQYTKNSTYPVHNIATGIFLQPVPLCSEDKQLVKHKRKTDAHNIANGSDDDDMQACMKHLIKYQGKAVPKKSINAAHCQIAETLISAEGGKLTNHVAAHAELFPQGYVVVYFKEPWGSPNIHSGNTAALHSVCRPHAAPSRPAAVRRSTFLQWCYP